MLFSLLVFFNISKYIYIYIFSLNTALEWNVKPRLFSWSQTEMGNEMKLTTLPLNIKKNIHKNKCCEKSIKNGYTIRFYEYIIIIEQCEGLG